MSSEEEKTGGIDGFLDAIEQEGESSEQ